MTKKNAPPATSFFKNLPLRTEISILYPPTQLFSLLFFSFWMADSRVKNYYNCWKRESGYRAILSSCIALNCCCCCCFFPFSFSFFFFVELTQTTKPYIVNTDGGPLNEDEHHRRKSRRVGRRVLRHRRRIVPSSRERLWRMDCVWFSKPLPAKQFKISLTMSKEDRVK